jgi:hypothetical protein
MARRCGFLNRAPLHENQAAPAVREWQRVRLRLTVKRLIELTQVASLEQVDRRIRFSKNLLALVREPFFNDGGVNAAEIGVELEIAII